MPQFSRKTGFRPTLKLLSLGEKHSLAAVA